MSKVKITLDIGKPGAPIRNILGMCNSPRIRHASRMEQERTFFQKLNPARVRYHDAALENPGFAVIDVTRIFPLFHADAENPENYDFAATDFYLKQIASSGSEIEFRLGETIELSSEKFRVKPPPDPVKWADICIHIIRHYNEGWANGMQLGIRYWSIWEEPDSQIGLFIGPFERYLELYAEIARRIRAEFPELRIGGPNTRSPNKKGLEQFLKYCQAHSLPVDFLEVTLYKRDLRFLTDYAEYMKDLAVRYGYPEAEIIFSEWHYEPANWDKIIPEEMFDEVNAAFSVSSLIRLLETPLSMVYYYCWGLLVWGLFAPDRTPLPVYYGLCWFTEMTGCKAQVPCQVEETLPEGISLLAGIEKDDSVSLLVSCYKSARADFSVRVPGYSHCILSRLEHKILIPEQQELVISDAGNFDFQFDSGGSAVFLMKFAKRSK